MEELPLAAQVTSRALVRIRRQVVVLDVHKASGLVLIEEAVIVLVRSELARRTFVPRRWHQSDVHGLDDVAQACLSALVTQE